LPALLRLVLALLILSGCPSAFASTGGTISGVVKDLPVGQYAIEVKQQGFKNYIVNGLIISVNSALRVDVTLEIGTA